MERWLTQVEISIECTISHEDDVRGICVCGDAIATSSRDRTVRFWSLDQENKHKYTISKILLGHSSFVGPLAWISPNESFPEGGVVSGGMDTLILTWDLKTGEYVQTLKGHQQQVTGIAVDDNADIVSASVDCTVRRWRNGQPIECWEAHKAAIQAVIKLPSGELITGSSDATLKLWRGKTCVHTFVGHTDTVRGLAVMPGLGILSGSHDGSIRLWALSGEVLMEMVGHTSIIYSVDAHVSGRIVSGSEDCFAKIWKDGICVQSIEHPGCVWDAKFLENGDIVTGCSDGLVRIWSLNKDRIANSLEQESYASQLSQYKCSRKRVGGLKLEDLPGLDALQIPGLIDYHTKVVREGDNGVAYSWNSTDQKWDKIGEVVDGPDDSIKRPILDGIEYDYVFDVDIGDGEPIRKLPYNQSDNPYTTADKWLLKENLPFSYRQQIIEFILQNAGQRDFALDTSFRDPYTGSSAYIPGGPSNVSGVLAKPTFKHIPKKGMLFFDAAQFDGILKKIGEFNNALLAGPEQKNLSLTELELSRLVAVVKILKDTSHYHCSKFADIDIALLLKVLKSWPLAMMFPVIDILRMIILHPDGANILFKNIGDENDILMGLIKKVTMAPALPANLLTSIRAVTNLFKNSFFFHWLQMHCSEILDAFSSSSSFNKNASITFYSELTLISSQLFIENLGMYGPLRVMLSANDLNESLAKGLAKDGLICKTLTSLLD
ncbi:hypothetical protein HHK36_010062 [Tetracentron sinense]|uniref:Phospholipase A-2-activating protein n=1 Tax=Tetracentron sinense TaxID=13715 RepID=A0A835DIS9_TETSI|nr:hypothetical protein HHK36_010062 [Tetracentron sinense]